MTGTNDAPERIWIDPSSEDENGILLCDSRKAYLNHDTEYLRRDLVNRLLAEEREKCARVAENAMSDNTEGLNHPYDQGWVRSAQRIAAAIRAMGDD